MKKVLIGGQALVELGSSRSTHDKDYLIYDESNFDTFITGDDDLINAANHEFYKAVWNCIEGDKVSPQLLSEMKAFALVNHFTNGFQNKVNDACFDIRFLNINYNVEPKLVFSFVTEAEADLIKEVINQIK